MWPFSPKDTPQAEPKTQQVKPPSAFLPRPLDVSKKQDINIEDKLNFSQRDLALLCIGGIVALSAGSVCRRIYLRHIKRFPSANWLTPDVLREGRLLRGVVTHVKDGDNFRIYHKPALRLGSVPATDKELRGQTIHIRIAGYDAPESGYFGNPAQPHAKESTEYLKSRILGKSILVKPVSKDQYSRLVALVYIPRIFLPNKDLAAELLKAGCGVVYDQAGAQYGKIGFEGYKKLEEEAKQARVGMWQKGLKVELPSDYKRRIAVSPASKVDEESATPSADTPKSFWKIWQRNE
ncbi:hypothetical protein CVT24_008738 [Panaeolus cyanescens]|uniref:TNase-like domain-containing protein n=1 Tax=Panaeolus cyanescens TaxID=181874 RepID=A0A409VET0_9AGAR|nr:hypothetical protein CVT24_008738 [Panaeolus cyanescens]